MHRFPHFAQPQRSVEEFLHTDVTLYNVFRKQFESRPISPMLDCGNDGATNSSKWINNHVAGTGKPQHKSFDQFNRELTWVFGFLDVVGLDVRHLQKSTVPLECKTLGVVDNNASPRLGIE